MIIIIIIIIIGPSQAPGVPGSAHPAAEGSLSQDVFSSIIIILTYNSNI